MTRRAVRVGTCKCGTKILTGLDADWCGIPVTLDHAPIDEVGEALAALTARQTYDLRPAGGRNHGREMEPRSGHRISQPRHWAVHAEHRCGQPLPPAPATARREFATAGDF